MGVITGGIISEGLIPRRGGGVISEGPIRSNYYLMEISNS